MAKKSLQETYSRVMEKTPAQAYRATQDDPSVNTGDSAVRMYQAVMGAPETYRAYGNRGQSQGNSAYQKYQSIMNGAGGNRTQKITDWTNRYSRLASGLKNGYTQELVDEADSLAKAYNGASGVAYAARRDERDALEKIYKSLLEIGTDGKKQLARDRTASGLLPEDASALAGQKQKYERMLFELQKQRDTFLKDNPQTVASGAFAETQEITPMGNYGAIAGQDTVGYGTQPTAQQKQLDALMQSIRETQGTIGDINSQLNIYNRIDKFGDDVTAKYAGGNSMEARDAWRTGKNGREQTFREKEQALRKDSTPYAARESGASGNAYAAALSNPQSADFTERLNDYKSEKNLRIIDRLDEYLTWFDGLSEEAQNRVKTSDVTGQAIARDIELAKNPNPGSQNRHWEQMTEDERNAAFRIASTEGTEAAAKYLDDLQMTLDRRHTLAMEEAERAKAEGTPLAVDMLRGVATVPENLIGAPISFIGNAVDTVRGKGLNPYSNANFFLNQSGAVREASSQEVYRAIAGDGSNKKLDFLGTLASNAYQAGLSTLDSLAGMATMGKFYTISMGMGAASQRMRELVESGASDREIYVGAIGSGILEALFEKVSLDTFADQWIKANPEKFIRKALIQAGVEGSEEVFTEISNQILDAVNRGVNSDHNVRVRALMKENPGMSETEAEQQAASEDAQEVFWAGFGGALSGGLSSFGGLAIEGHKAREGGTEILNRGQAGEVLQNALELRPNDEAAQNLQAKLSDNTLGKKGRDLSGLYRVAQQNAADMTHADVEAVRAGLENRLTEMGVPNNGKATAEAIIKQITGEKLSLTDRLALAKNRDAAATVRSEIISAAIEETAENKWVRDIKTFQLGRLGHGKQAFGTAETQTQKSARETMEKALNQVMGSNSAIVSTMYDEGQSRSDFTTEAAEIYRAGQDGRGLDGVSLSTIGADDAVRIYNMGVRSAEGVGTYDYIEEGQAYRKSDSTPVNVTGFASMGAEPTVSIGNGETVKASDITFGSFGESRLYNTIAKMGVDTQTANDMLKAAENANINASTYSVALNNAYMQGLSGIAFGNIRENSEAMRLDADTRKAAWSAGRAQAERNDRAKQSVTDKGKHGRKAGGLTVEDSAKNVKLNRQQEAGMNAARVLAGMGLNVSVFASTEAERKDDIYNGIFRSADGSIRVDLNAGKDGQGVMGYALSHEFTHFVEELSAEKFRKFTDILFDVLGKNDVDVNRLIEAKEAVLRNTEEYKGRSDKDLRAIAYSEAVAEMMEPVLTDTDAISRISQKIKQQDKSLWGKIKDFIKGIVEKLKAAYRDMEPDSAIARLTRETVTNSEAVLDAFSEAAADAVLNYNLQEGQKNNARGGGLYSLRNQTQQELTTEYQAEVDSILSMQDTTQRQLVVGYTPSVYQELGMPSLPLTIGSGHVYSTAKTEAQARKDGNYKRGVHYHGLGDVAVKNIYNAIQDPVMIIAAKDVNKNASPMRSTHSVVAIVDIGTAGKSLLVPIEITAERKVNGIRMDVNTISSVYEKSVKNLVTEAIAQENSGDIGIFYAKKEALTLPGAGVQFPVQLQQSIASNSIVHRFSEKVNMKISENTQSQQFKRWFGDWQNDPANASKVVNADGTPKVMYHGTNAEFTVFDRSKGKKKIHLNVLGDGNYFTASEQGAARYGENVIPVYLNIKNPYVKADGFNTVADQIASEFGIARDSFTGKDVSSILRQRGYDGVVMYDGNGEIVIANAFDSNQIKSATDNVGTFDGSNPDIRYSSRDSAGNALTEAQQRYFADSQVRDEDGNLIPVYHRTDGDFTVFQRGKLGGATLSNAADAGLAATSLVGHWFSDHDLGDLIGKNVVQSYLNIQNPYETDLLSLAQEIAGFSSNPEMMQEHFEDGQYNMVRKAAAEFTAWLRSEGYDGLKVTDQENGGVSYAVLDSRQAKLTTNQNPTGARDIRYSSRTALDSEYLNLAQNPEENREALSRMVEQAAREAGYDSPMLYHGTQSFGFTNFDLDKMDDKRSIFLTSNPDIAATYSGVDGSRNIGKASGTDISTLSLQEVAQMMNQFPPESGMDYQYSVVESKAEISGQVDRGLNELNNLIDTLKKQYGKDSKEYGRLEKLQNTLYLGTNDGLSTQLWMILKQTDLFKGHEDFVNGLEQNLRLLKKAPESGSFLVEKALGGYSIDVLSEADAKEELAQNMQRGNYALYARLGNTLTVEGEGQRWNNLKNWAKGMEVDENSTYVMEDDGKFFLLRKADDSVVENGVIEATEKARELSPDALQFLLIQKANTSLRILTEVATTTRDVTKWAKNAGYDSVIFKNIKDSGGQNNSVSMDTTADIYVIFNPNDAKSADAVTYDDNGNVIPLSQRFDTGKEDIRYSARNPQAQVEAENERLKSDVKRQIAEAVREYRRQQDVQSKAYRQMYERQLEEVKKSYQKQISTMESEYSANLAQIQDAFFQTVEAYEKGQFRNEHLEKVLKQAAETQRAQVKASEADNATWEKEFNRLLRAYETSGRNVQRLKQTVENQRARAKAKVEAARVTEQRGKLYRAVNEINRRLLNPTKTLYVPDSLAPAVTKFMQGLTEAMESPENSWNVQGALETLQGQYQKLTQMNEGVFTQEYNQGILDLLDNAISAVGGTDFNKLSASQIEDVYSAVRSVLTAIRNENKMFAANLNKTYAEAAEAVRREESALPNRKPTTGAVQDKAEKFGWNQLKPVYAMMRLGSDTLLKQYNNLRAGEDKWQRVIAAARAYGLGTMAKYNYDQWNDSLMKLDTETGTVELSLQERMSLYAYARREQAFEHLTKGGFVLSDKNTRTVKNRFGIETEQKVQDYNAYVLTADQVAGIRGAENILHLTEEQRQFADAMQDYLSTVCAELNNEISRALYGVSIAKEKYYWPIRSSGVFSEMIRNQMQNPSNRQKNAGHMKATVRGANNAIELMGFMETWATHVNNTAMYNAFTLPMEDFMRVWNWRDTSGLGNRSMRQLILQKHGQAGVDYIDTFIKDLNKGVRGDPRESLLNSMLGKFKKGAVSASLSVAIQQPSAVGRALKYIDPKYFLGARVEGVDGINATWEVMQQYAPVVGIKDIGRFDMDMGRSTIDILSGKNETGVMAAIDKLSGFLPEYMDKVTWVAMWEACKRQVKAQNPSLRGEALLTKAGELFTKTITETQVYDSVFSRSGLMRSPSVAAKAVTAFMAEPTTTANMVYQAIQDFRHGDRTGAARSLASVGTAIVLNSLLASLVYASRDDDEEKTWLEKYLKSFTAEMIDGVNPLGYIPVVKDIFSVFQGYDVIRSDMSQWADLAKTLQKFTKAWKSYGEADEDDKEARKEALKKAGIASTNLLASILNLGGIPLRNLLREIQGGVNIVKDIQRGLPSDSRTKGYAIWEALNEYMPQIMRSDDGKSKQVYKAVTSGSAAWVNRLKSTYKNEDTFNRAVVTALVNNDSRIREAARAAVSGNSAERDRLAKEIVKEGRFTEDQVEAAIEKRIGQLPGASYDDMLDALRNGGDVKAAQANLAKYGYTQTQMENKVKSAAKEWYQGGVISAIDARKMLRDYGGMLTRDAQATVQKWTALLSTGTDFDEIQDEYLTGNLSRSRAVEMYVKFGGHSQADAEATVKKWDCEKELGVKYDDLKDAYLGGDISADRVLSAMMKYGGVKEDSARATVEAYKWIRNHPKTELDVGQVKTYTKAIDTLGYSVEDAGISESVYLTFLEKASACTGEDRNGDGRTDSGSVRNQVVQVIDALPISGAQKDALYFAKGYAKRDLHKAPWH